MPFMNGYEVAREIREMEKSNFDSEKGRLPIFACTAALTHEVVQNCASAGIDDIINKVSWANANAGHASI